MANDPKLNAALGITAEAPKKGAAGANGELNRGRIVDEFKVNNPEKAALPNPAAPKWDKPKH